MTDNEMLELASKVAGIAIYCSVGDTITGALQC